MLYSTADVLVFVALINVVGNVAVVVRLEIFSSVIVIDDGITRENDQAMPE